MSTLVNNMSTLSHTMMGMEYRTTHIETHVGEMTHVLNFISTKVVKMQTNLSDGQHTATGTPLSLKLTPTPQPRPRPSIRQWPQHFVVLHIIQKRDKHSYGSRWWFCTQRDGRRIDALAEEGRMRDQTCTQKDARNKK